MGINGVSNVNMNTIFLSTLVAIIVLPSIGIHARSSPGVSSQANHNSSCLEPNNLNDQLKAAKATYIANPCEFRKNFSDKNRNDSVSVLPPTSLQFKPCRSNRCIFGLKSTCKFFEYEDSNQHRYPRVVKSNHQCSNSTACKVKGCELSIHTLSHKCRAIVTPVVVLVASSVRCNHGYRVYEPRLIDRTVGFTCVSIADFPTSLEVV